MGFASLYSPLAFLKGKNSIRHPYMPIFKWHLLKYTAIFLAGIAAVAVLINGYFAFLADRSGLHGFEYGMPMFLNGMFFWGLVAAGNMVGFVIAIHISAPLPVYAHKRKPLYILSIGVLSALSVPVLNFLQPLVGSVAVLFQDGNGAPSSGNALLWVWMIYRFVGSAGLSCLLSSRAIALAHKKGIFLTPGLCVHCGYDLRGSSSRTCPECGGVVKDGETSK